jgi:hypothetical protein
MMVQLAICMQTGMNAWWHPCSVLQCYIAVLVAVVVVSLHPCCNLRPPVTFVCVCAVRCQGAVTTVEQCVPSLCGCWHTPNILNNQFLALELSFLMAMFDMVFLGSWYVHKLPLGGRVVAYGDC